MNSQTGHPMKPQTPGCVAEGRPSHAKTRHDHLTLPDGRKVGDVDTPELVRRLEAAGIPGVAPDRGRDRNVESYADHLAGIGKAGAEQAVSAWLHNARAE
jgi:hypothetical protein